jgi:hypothetical protein
MSSEGRRNVSMSVSSGVAHQGSEPNETTKVTPLLSDEGKEFLEGKIDAAEYMQDARRRVEDVAARQVSQQVRFRPSRRLRVLPFILACIAYIVVALISFAQSKGDTGTAALITAAIAGAAAALVYQLSSRPSSDRKGLRL